MPFRIKDYSTRVEEGTVFIKESVKTIAKNRNDIFPFIVVRLGIDMAHELGYNVEEVEYDKYISFEVEGINCYLQIEKGIQGDDALFGSVHLYKYLPYITKSVTFNDYLERE